MVIPNAYTLAGCSLLALSLLMTMYIIATQKSILRTILPEMKLNSLFQKPFMAASNKLYGEPYSVLDENLKIFDETGIRHFVEN